VGLGTIVQAAATHMMIQARVGDLQRGRVLAIYTAMFLGALLALLAAAFSSARVQAQNRRAAAP
jgi:hypothetical protein